MLHFVFQVLGKNRHKKWIGNDFLDRRPHKRLLPDGRPEFLNWPQSEGQIGGMLFQRRLKSHFPS